MWVSSQDADPDSAPPPPHLLVAVEIALQVSAEAETNPGPSMWGGRLPCQENQTLCPPPQKMAFCGENGRCCPDVRRSAHQPPQHLSTRPASAVDHDSTETARRMLKRRRLSTQRGPALSPALLRSLQTQAHTPPS